LANWHLGDTKYGRLVGTDRAGNKYFENLEELPLRTRWVEYSKHDYDAAQIEPGWHAWISYSLDKPPTEDALIAVGLRKFEKPYATPNYTQTRGAFKTYST
jgi:NADH:ubiquinone oxidoreductase subunit